MGSVVLHWDDLSRYLSPSLQLLVCDGEAGLHALMTSAFCEPGA